MSKAYHDWIFYFWIVRDNCWECRFWVAPVLRINCGNESACCDRSETVNLGTPLDRLVAKKYIFNRIWCKSWNVLIFSLAWLAKDDSELRWRFRSNPTTSQKTCFVPFACPFLWILAYWDPVPMSFARIVSMKASLTVKSVRYAGVIANQKRSCCWKMKAA